MAMSLIIECTNCDNSLEQWSDGNPYYIDPRKIFTAPRSRCKVYVYHPDIPDFPIAGNDVPHLCLSCNHQFNVDTEKPRTSCTKCRSRNIVDAWRSGGKPCPKCKKGTLVARDSGCFS